MSSKFPRQEARTLRAGERMRTSLAMPKTKVLLGVTGSVAAIKVPELVRELTRVPEVEVRAHTHTLQSPAVPAVALTAPINGRGLAKLNSAGPSCRIIHSTYMYKKMYIIMMYNLLELSPTCGSL